jgi:hypothetical protein
MSGNDRLRDLILEAVGFMRLRFSWVHVPTIIHIKGGLPGPARRAVVGDLVLEARAGEIREAFEARVLQEAEALAIRGQPCHIAYGGLPRLPGTTTIMPKPTAIGRSGGDWWGDDDPPDDDAPPELPRLPPLVGVRPERS